MSDITKIVDLGFEVVRVHLVRAGECEWGELTFMRPKGDGTEAESFYISLNAANLQKLRDALSDETNLTGENRG